ncbi:MAG: carbamoyltransferase HypF [Candidatus Zixiibacteriota bacterium]
MRRYQDTANLSERADAALRLRIVAKGLVQGVGFRPFVHRLASDIGLPGWVRNSAEGVQIELEGGIEKLDEFVSRLQAERPPRSHIDELVTETLTLVGYSRFKVRESHDDCSTGITQITPDIATCSECIQDVFDPGNRRYRYPFTNCTNCGPRFSIIQSLPYDRVNTTMNKFPMCGECRDEYENPENRRFHAQPNACPNCGPHLELWDGDGKVVAMNDQALVDACAFVTRGRIVALKGLGGFQLVVDAGNEDAVKYLRKRKARMDKPFALMCPSLRVARNHCELSHAEMHLLASPESPIVLLKRKSGTHREPSSISHQIAPDSPYLGVMLPYTPLHHLIMADLKSPVVATSGNLADEPICTDERDALVRLSRVADYFLVHDRPIARQMDDSIVQHVAGSEMVLRSARGYAPVTIRLRKPGAECLAVGSHLKNTVAISDGRNACLSQYIGDLSTKRALDVLSGETKSLASIYRIRPRKVCCDEHPDYNSARFAASLGQPIAQVQHHFAHILSCMAEHDLGAPVLGVSWDGTGLGTDGTIWGGEFLRVTERGFTRAAHLRPFPLPGGDIAVREPRRSAIGLLYEIFGDALFATDNVKSVKAFCESERRILRRMLERSLNAPRTSSAGRLFDAVASITGICQTASFEGQAAMKLQFAAEAGGDMSESYEYRLVDSCIPYSLDWEPMIRGILHDMQESIPVDTIAARYHRTLVNMILSVAGRIGERRVVLTGGCFQNRLLVEQSVSALQASGFEPYWHRRIPPNDSGIAMGQIFMATVCTVEEE